MIPEIFFIDPRLFDESTLRECAAVQRLRERSEDDCGRADRRHLKTREQFLDFTRRGAPRRYGAYNASFNEVGHRPLGDEFANANFVTGTTGVYGIFDAFAHD